MNNQNKITKSVNSTEFQAYVISNPVFKKTKTGEEMVQMRVKTVRYIDENYQGLYLQEAKKRQAANLLGKSLEYTTFEWIETAKKFKMSSYMYATSFKPNVINSIQKLGIKTGDKLKLNGIYFFKEILENELKPVAWFQVDHFKLLSQSKPKEVDLEQEKKEDNSNVLADEYKKIEPKIELEDEEEIVEDFKEPSR